MKKPVYTRYPLFYGDVPQDKAWKVQILDGGDWCSHEYRAIMKYISEEEKSTDVQSLSELSEKALLVYNNGVNAYNSGKSIKTCPYNNKSEKNLSILWKTGYKGVKYE